jgi:hypothetical protein
MIVIWGCLIKFIILLSYIKTNQNQCINEFGTGSNLWTKQNEE